MDSRNNFWWKNSWRHERHSKFRILACEALFKPNLLKSASKWGSQSLYGKSRKCFKFDFFTRILVLLYGKHPPKTCYTLGRTWGVIWKHYQASNSQNRVITGLGIFFTDMCLKFWYWLWTFILDFIRSKNLISKFEDVIFFKNQSPKSKSQPAKNSQSPKVFDPANQWIMNSYRGELCTVLTNLIMTHKKKL